MRLDTAAQARQVILESMRQALRTVANQLDADIDELFLEDKWPWPNGTTQRRSGELAGSPRNIYDLGALYESETERITEQGTRIILTREWEALNDAGQDYAPMVHNGTSKTEPRPWTTRIKAEKEQLYAQLFFSEFQHFFYVNTGDTRAAARRTGVAGGFGAAAPGGGGGGAGMSAGSLLPEVGLAGDEAAGVEPEPPDNGGLTP